MLPAPAHHHVVIVEDHGGLVHSYSARVSQYLKRRVTVRVDGLCASACTMVTALPPERICFAPGARLMLHQAYNPNPANPFDTTRRNKIGTAILLARYPNVLRAWIEDHDGLGPDMLTLEGDELAAMFPMCPRRDR